MEQRVGASRIFMIIDIVLSGEIMLYVTIGMVVSGTLSTHILL